ncbi:transposase-like protein [Rhizobium mongolense]
MGALLPQFPYRSINVTVPPGELVHRQVKYLNNVVEADHGKLKQLIRPVERFQNLENRLRDDQGF